MECSSFDCTAKACLSVRGCSWTCQGIGNWSSSWHRFRSNSAGRVPAETAVLKSHNPCQNVGAPLVLPAFGFVTGGDLSRPANFLVICLTIVCGRENGNRLAIWTSADVVQFLPLHFVVDFRVQTGVRSDRSLSIFTGGPDVCRAAHASFATRPSVFGEFFQLFQIDKTRALILFILIIFVVLLLFIGIAPHCVCCVKGCSLSLVTTKIQQLFSDRVLR
jgi:hypothetical protein